MIKAQSITKTFHGGKTKALQGVSLEITDGDFVVILGASGSGKSTLLRVLSGLEYADGGQVFYDDKDIESLNDKELTALRKDTVGIVFQQYYLLPHLSVEANVKLGADLVGNRDYLQYLDAVGLGDKRRVKPSMLSGGEQQRVCIARALAKKPEVLFLDEPTGALDEQTGREVLDYIVKLQKENKFTMIMVTHNQNIAEMANTVVRMNSGQIVKTTCNAHCKSAYEIGW